MTNYLKKREEFFDSVSEQTNKEAEFHQVENQIENKSISFRRARSSFESSPLTNSQNSRSMRKNRSVTVDRRRERHSHSHFFRMRTSKSEVPIKGILKKAKTYKSQKSDKKVKFDTLSRNNSQSYKIFLFSFHYSSI